MATPLRKYVPNLPTLQAICERNYVHLLSMLPDCDTEELIYRFSAGKGLSYQIQIIESARYTSTLAIEQVDVATPDFMKPAMTVRLYHDARMAEVVHCSTSRRFEARYRYPNPDMLQRDEKFQQNRFAAELLEFCLNNGRSVDAVSGTSYAGESDRV